MTYRDRTFCASKHCTNECGRKLSNEERAAMPNWMPLSLAYFCGIEEEKLDNLLDNRKDM